ncbi:uncharacterized protein Bfra_011078 [Botrytis fragariae]|uniref:Uncharacterized protein n=1 Tax=Botrytis fragariae TaxID=1964551 RepID=A0A8H6AL54_9HELO|nr:uncharacterized protein Bfra_011078 [Botrytis fragariae]KAF5869270.1 hypothetical protein Bfra_011078 [Botrytis fragariae]
MFDTSLLSTMRAHSFRIAVRIPGNHGPAWESHAIVASSPRC